MKVVFVSNYINHHQRPFCEEMYKRLGNDFWFISTSVMREERRQLGYALDGFDPYVLLAHEGEQQHKEALKLINTADIVIAGSAPDEMFRERIRQDKILLRYSERIYKKKASFPKRVYSFFRLRQRDIWKSNIYMLCASAYTAGDYESIGMYKNRTYKWGYFPEQKTYDLQLLLANKKANVLMWCGRFIDWKHPDDAILVAKKLKEFGYDFQLNMIGTGDMKNELLELVEDLGLSNNVNFLGSMPAAQVRTHMEEAGIYLFTSDRQEGWGAVLNESMNSGCAVVASHTIGSVPYLVNNNENGMIYLSGNIDMMFEKVKYLLDNPNEQKRLGCAAYQTITETWNPKYAAERILQLSEKLMEGEIYPDLFKDGMCSKALNMNNNWFKEIK